MRPIDELIRDAQREAGNGKEHLLINQAELRQLKDYDLVVGTDNPNVARFTEIIGGVPTGFQLHVVEVLP